MPKPSRPFANRREREFDKAMRKFLSDYHGAFMRDGHE